MQRNKLTKKDIDRVLPPKEKEEAIEQSERYEKEYETSKRKLDEILQQLEEMMKSFENV